MIRIMFLDKKKIIVIPYFFLEPSKLNLIYMNLCDSSKKLFI